jgi:hypothetical protein
VIHAHVHATLLELLEHLIDPFSASVDPLARLIQER